MVRALRFATAFLAAAAFDDRNAYVTFYPKWHERLVSGVGRVTRMAGALLLFFLSTHHMLGVFFFLPIKPLSRAQRAMVVYAIVLGELCVTFLFFGTNQPSALARLWATVIDCGAVFFVDTFIALFATYLVDLVVRFIRREVAKKNIANKTLMDDRLLL